MEVYRSSKTAKEFEFALDAIPSIGENGNWFIGGVDTGVLAEGLTPYVGNNGNWWVGEEDTGIYAGGVKVEGAEVGQTIVVKAVNEKGVPTEWETADMGEKPFPEIPQFDITIEEEVQVLAFSEYDGKTLSEYGFTRCYVYVMSPAVETKDDGELTFSINAQSSLNTTETIYPRASAGTSFMEQTSTKYWHALYDLIKGQMQFSPGGSTNAAWTVAANTVTDVTKLFGGKVINNFKFVRVKGIIVGTNIKIWLA